MHILPFLNHEVTVISRPLPLWDESTVQMYLLPIHVKDFSHEKFFEYDIPLPPTIARSVVKRQAEYFFGRLAARHALTSFGLGYNLVGIGLSREPLWPTNIIGSITHNQHYAAAVVLHRNANATIGIDLESVISTDMCDSLLATAVSPAELCYLNSLKTSLPIEVLLTIIFSAKESFFKAAFPFVGRYFGFDAVVLRAFDCTSRTLTFEIREYLCVGLAPGTTRIAYYDIIDPWTICTNCNWSLT